MPTQTTVKQNSSPTFTIVPVSDVPSIVRAASKYSKVIEAARTLKVGDAIRMPLPLTEEGEPNRNSTLTLRNHLNKLPATKVAKEFTINQKVFPAGNYQLKIGSRTENGKVVAYIQYALQREEPTTTQ